MGEKNIIDNNFELNYGVQHSIYSQQKTCVLKYVIP